MRQLNTEIEINASAETVWSVLMDFNTYGEWNPFVRSISGNPEAGSAITVRVQPTGSKGMTFNPLVIKAVPNETFVWKGKLGLNGIFDGQHEFTIRTNGNGAVKFIHREEFTGILVPILWPMLEKGTRQGFEEMNEALKERAEARK